MVAHNTKRTRDWLSGLKGWNEEMDAARAREQKKNALPSDLPIASTVTPLKKQRSAEWRRNISLKMAEYHKRRREQNG